jgi:murein DD-endopeptidase MepM/ murein hydrolase activator NlpD
VTTLKITWKDSAFAKFDLLRSVTPREAAPDQLRRRNIELARTRRNFCSHLLLMISGYAVSVVPRPAPSCTPPNAPPDISSRMPADDAAPHQGISIGGRGYFGHEIVAPAEGVVVFSRGNHVRIHHGMDSKRQDIYTHHYHVYGGSLVGDRVQRGQTLGQSGGRNVSVPHYHYVVIKESSRKFIPLNPNDYWFGIDQYKEKLEKASTLTVCNLLF